MKSSKKRMNSKKSAVIALSVMLALTILFGVLGFTGLKFPPRGLYKLLSWLPTSDSANWPESLPLGLDLRGGMYVEYKGSIPDDADPDVSYDDLVDGTIDIIATDHAPHSAEEKSRGLAGSAMGIVGLETAFPLLYTHLVEGGILSLERLVEVMAEAPRRIFGLGSALDEGSYALFDLETPYVIDASAFVSKGKATPFDGWTVKGNCLLNVHKNKIVYGTLE